MPKGRRKGLLKGLNLREKQVLDVLYKHGPGSSSEIQQHIEDDLSNSTIRTILRALKNKGYVDHKGDFSRYTYYALEDNQSAGHRVFDKMIDTFFSGSLTDAVATFIDKDADNISNDELDELMSLIQKAKKNKNEQ